MYSVYTYYTRSIHKKITTSFYNAKLAIPWEPLLNQSQGRGVAYAYPRHAPPNINPFAVASL